MAYTTATLTGTYQHFDGSPASGVIEIIPNSPTLIDGEGNVILSGRVKVTLDAEGSFSVTLPATDDASVEPAIDRQYAVVAKLRHQHLAAVTGIELPTAGTRDMADMTSAAAVTASLSTWLTQEDYDALGARVTTLETTPAVTSYNDLTDTPSLAPVATSGTYADLSGKPTIPTAADYASKATQTTVETGRLSEAGLSASFARKGNPSPSLAALPRLLKAVRTHNDASPTTLRVIGLGSSVGLGPNGGIDATNAASRKVFDGIGGVFNRLGNLTLAHTNGSVAGSVITSGQQTDYATAKTAAGGSPALVVLAYGMNDGQSAQYHAGQTFPGVYNNGKTLVEAAQADGADVIILTTAHPHTTRNSWAVPGGITVSYAGSGTEPAETTYPTDDAAGSVVTVTSPSGASVPASYRHLRVNEALRQLAADTGSVLIDVEPYWFDAVAEHGQDALFDTGEYVHPNLFAFQETYHQAVADVFAGIATAPAFAAPAPAKEERLVRKANNTTRTSTSTLADDPELKVSLAANQTWIVEFEVHYTTPNAADFRLNVAGPTGTSGRFSLIASDLAGSTSGGGAPAITRSTVITPGNYLNAGGNGADAVARVRALVRMGSTAGTVAFQWAQEVSTAVNTTVYADSYLRATRVS